MAIATSLSPSSAPAVTVVGSPGDGRVDAFQQALARAGRPAARIVDYIDLAGEPGPRRVAGLVRFESPGRELPVRRALYALGAGALEEEGGRPLVGRELDEVLSDRGRLASSRQLHLGLMRAISRVAGDSYMNHPVDIALAFDKPRCQLHLDAAGVPVPRPLGMVGSYAELRDIMASHRAARVFVKLRHGSAASGIAAFEAMGHREQAWTTAELAEDGGLYNTRAIRRYAAPAAVRRLVDALCAEGAYAERWLPKAALGGASCDLRVVVTAGEPTHWVVRAARTPLTNLHLGGQRLPIDVLRTRMSLVGWQGLVRTCRRVAQLFPHSLYLGIDLAVARGFRSHAVLEVNAFGDYVKGVLSAGRTPHDVQLEALCG